ncbi:MAG: putative rane-bound dehydrogenase domain protein, partial [Planctomycetaceae bacterium]|nr:putative rane-bound dehydrogenase domain protein [Planctomycetaceae bacterium]
MIRLLTLVCLLACLPLNSLQAADADWSLVPVPGVWEQAAGGKFEKYDGFAWYRCSVKVPLDWRGRDLQLKVQKIDDAYEAYVNGQKVGGEGAFPPSFKSGLSDRAVSLTVPADAVRVGEWNTVAFRIYDQEGQGGFKGVAPFLGDDVRAIELKGDWQFRTGDDPTWAKPDAAKPTVATFAKMEEIGVISVRNKPKDTKPPRLSLADSLAALTSPDDLEIEQVLTEPLVAQPLFVNFDERGRMWVMQYLQYPNPAGLKIV